jgi:hypothetical protein
VSENEHEHEENEIRPSTESPDPSGAYGVHPGRTGKPPEGERPADETVPPERD